MLAVLFFCFALVSFGQPDDRDVRPANNRQQLRKPERRHRLRREVRLQDSSAARRNGRHLHLKNRRS